MFVQDPMSVDSPHGEAVWPRGRFPAVSSGAAGCSFSSRSMAWRSKPRRSIHVCTILLAVCCVKSLLREGEAFCGQAGLVSGFEAPTQFSDRRLRGCGVLRCRSSESSDASEDALSSEETLITDDDMAVLWRRMAEVEESSQRKPFIVLDAMVPGQVARFESDAPVWEKLQAHGEIGVVGTWQKSPLSHGVLAQVGKIGSKVWELRALHHVKLVEPRTATEDALDEGENYATAILERIDQEVEEIDVVVARSLGPLVQEWQELVRDIGAERFKGHLEGVLKDLGPMPEAAEAGSLAFWTVALVNPLPALGVAYELRPAILSAETVSMRLQVALNGIRGSIEILRDRQSGK
eukprot:TRINITY_DN101872_c0_g1_i1.p1 TRINITY_DN101872_c0_g1~~TRINITY_DN101872_c0_g1_i1.p1  ORF type:complete len:369 (+),score=57.71 TRINITY_DN101872_c0_g1_i1:58-1107(+)